MKRRFVALMLIGCLAISGCQSTPKESENNKQEEVNNDMEKDMDGEDIEERDGGEQEIISTVSIIPTAEPSAEPTEDPIQSVTPTSIVTPTLKPTATPEPTIEITETPKPTHTKEPSVVTPSVTKEPTVTPTPTETDTTTVHVHVWSAITEIVEYEEEGHWEDVIVKAAWTETTGGSWRTICNGCDVDMTDMEDDEFALHGAVICQSSYGNRWIETTIEHPAVTEKQWIVDKEAYEETVVIGYKCECGETK